MTQMPARTYAVIGGGIIGAAVARQLTLSEPAATVSLFEKEERLAAHQSGHNSGVVHAGLYYEPGSLKALLCHRGRELLQQFCRANDLPYIECGKVLVARNETERERLVDIHRRATANGVPGVRLLDAQQLRSIEPHVRGVAGLHSPHTAITDFSAVTRALAADAERHGARILTGHEVNRIRRAGEAVEVTAGGRGTLFDQVVVCAGLHADQVSVMADGARSPRIVPFRGKFYFLADRDKELVRGLVYPVPDPRYPFLGVHITPRVDGQVMVGPNAVLALSREGYRWHNLSPRDLAGVLFWRGFWRFATRHWRTGVHEIWGSLRKATFAEQVRRYLPEVRTPQLMQGTSGVRAQAMDDDGALVDDFRLVHEGPVLTVRNAPSPAATSSLAIAEHIVDRLKDRQGDQS